jgi:hypothetical protein
MSSFGATEYIHVRRSLVARRDVQCSGKVCLSLWRLFHFRGVFSSRRLARPLGPVPCIYYMTLGEVIQSAWIKTTKSITEVDINLEFHFYEHITYIKSKGQQVPMKDWCDAVASKLRTYEPRIFTLFIIAAWLRVYFWYIGFRLWMWI